MFPCLFQLVKAAHVPWPMAPSSIFKANRVASSNLVDSDPPFSLFYLQGSCDYLEPLRIIHGNNRILSLIMSAESVCLVRYHVGRFWGLRLGPLWGLLVLPAQGSMYAVHV